MKQKIVENRRNILIDKLISFHVYKKEDKHLYQLSLIELENEFSNFFLDSHPHSEIGSIKWCESLACIGLEDKSNI